MCRSAANALNILLDLQFQIVCKGLHVLREEHRLRMSEKRVPRRTFGPKRGEVIGVEKISL
jgi:hypothetical protein